MVDPDLNYFSAVQRSHRLDDWNSDDDDEVFNTAVPGSSGATGAVHDADRHNASPSSGVPKSLPAPDSAEGRERLEWQSMLASVLSGDILQGESSRIGMDRPGDEVFRKRLGHSLWWEIRARMRGRSGDEEKRRVEERRARVVDSVLEEVEGFVVKKSGRGLERALSAEQYGADHVADNEAESSALDQVSYILEKLRLVEGLYPHQAALRAAKQLYDSEAFQARVDALTAWFTVVTALQAQLLTLQKWTGSDDLDVTKPNTTKEKALVGKNRYHPLDAKAKVLAQAANDQAADDSTFLERVMKEDNISRTFEKRVFVEVLSLILNARETVISHLPKFEELQLPDFQYELVRLIGFPGRLIIEALKVRLDAAAKLVDPNPMVINDMIENFRLGISLAVLIKRQYEDIVAPDADRRWVIPHCLPSDYDAVLLGGLRTFFRLLHWKLKSGSKAIYFRETDVLEDEWEFLYEAAEAIEGGDLVVAEHFW
jgi:mitogen-activated protein kinase kinase kinase